MFLFELNVSVHLLKFREMYCTVVAVCIMHTCTYGFKRYFHFTWNSTLLIKVWLDVIFKSLSCNQQVCFGFVCGGGCLVIFFFLDNIYLPVSIHSLCSFWWVCVAADRQSGLPHTKSGQNMSCWHLESKWFINFMARYCMAELHLSYAQNSKTTAIENSLKVIRQICDSWCCYQIH